MLNFIWDDGQQLPCQKNKILKKNMIIIIIIIIIINTDAQCQYNRDAGKSEYKPMAELCLLDVNLLGTKLLFIIPTDMMSVRQERVEPRERCARTRPHMHTHTRTYSHGSVT
jgi:hypothetical protein